MTPDRWVLTVTVAVFAAALFGRDAVRRVTDWHRQARADRIEFEAYMQAEDERRALGRATRGER